MTLEQIREVRDANPFTPFTIHLADGRSHRVPHRDFLMLPPSGRIMFLHQIDESFRIIDLLLVTEVSVEVPPQVATTTTV